MGEGQRYLRPEACLAGRQRRLLDRLALMRREYQYQDVGSQPCGSRNRKRRPSYSREYLCERLVQHEVRFHLSLPLWKWLVLIG